MNACDLPLWTAKELAFGIFQSIKNSVKNGINQTKKRNAYAKNFLESKGIECTDVAKTRTLMKSDGFWIDSIDPPFIFEMLDKENFQLLLNSYGECLNLQKLLPHIGHYLYAKYSKPITPFGFDPINNNVFHFLGNLPKEGNLDLLLNNLAAGIKPPIRSKKRKIEKIITDILKQNFEDFELLKEFKLYGQFRHISNFFINTGYKIVVNAELLDEVPDVYIKIDKNEEIPHKQKVFLEVLRNNPLFGDSSPLKVNTLKPQGLFKIGDYSVFWSYNIAKHHIYTKKDADIFIDIVRQTMNKKFANLNVIDICSRAIQHESMGSKIFKDFFSSQSSPSLVEFEYLAQRTRTPILKNFKKQYEESRKIVLETLGYLPFEIVDSEIILENNLIMQGHFQQLSKHFVSIDPSIKFLPGFIYSQGLYNDIPPKILIDLYARCREVTAQRLGENRHFTPKQKEIMVKTSPHARLINGLRNTSFMDSKGRNYDANLSLTQTMSYFSKYA